MKNCSAFHQVGISGIVFEMQLFQNSSGGVFCSNEIWHGSEKKQVEFLQNLQIRRLKNSVRAQGSSLSRARERHKSFIHGLRRSFSARIIIPVKNGAIKTVTTYLDVLAVLT